MKIYDGEIIITNAYKYTIYDGETEMPIDVWSMVVKTDRGP